MPGKGIPVIEWAVVLSPNGNPHAVPFIQGKTMPGHMFRQNCNCSPKVTQLPNGKWYTEHRIVH
jgi:hypothetical protein